jgi:hypothetical protein
MKMDINNTQTQTTELLLDTPSQKKNYFQVDAMKAIMIALVIMDHTFTHAFLHQFGSSFWERISIPILMIIMGFNMGKSSEGKTYTKLKDYYSRTYFESKLKRYMIPYLLLYFIHGIMRIIVELGSIAINSPAGNDMAEYRYLGYTFFYGPGLWFIPVLFGTILVFPILYHNFKKNPIYTFVGTFIVEILTQVIMLVIIVLNNFELSTTVYYFLFSIFRLFSAIGIGLWLSVDHGLRSKHNRVIWILFPISLIYMIIYSLGMLPIQLPLSDYQLFFFPYSAVIFMVGMKLIPKNPTGKVSDFIRKISKSTYHILLTQILYFSIVFQFFLIMTDGNPETLDVFDATPLNYLWFYPLNLIITFGIGMLWKHLEERFYQKIPEKKSYQLFYRVLIKIASLAFVAWIVGQILFFIFV